MAIAKKTSKKRLIGLEFEVGTHFEENGKRYDKIINY